MLCSSDVEPCFARQARITLDMKGGYLPLYKVTDTPFHIQGDDLSYIFAYSCESLYIYINFVFYFHANIIHESQHPIVKMCT